MMESFSVFNKDFTKMLNGIDKNVRLAVYKTLEQTAEKARSAIIANYPKKFPDENGVVKNKGVPKMTSKTRVDKKNMSISLNWGQKKNVDFMDDQEYGAERKGLNGGSRAMPTWVAQRMGRKASGRMKAGYSVKNLMDQIMQYENKRSKETGKPKPFLMTSKSGHHMIARRRTKARDSFDVLYHFDRKVKIRPRWDFVKTVEGIAVHTIDKTFVKNLEESMKRM